MSKTYRVVAWSTGNVGRHAIAGIDARPDLELVGVWVSNPDKVGRDAGELAGLGRTLGVSATDDVDPLPAPPRRGPSGRDASARTRVQRSSRARPAPSSLWVEQQR